MIFLNLIKFSLPALRRFCLTQASLSTRLDSTQRFLTAFVFIAVRDQTLRTLMEPTSVTRARRAMISANLAQILNTVRVAKTLATQKLSVETTAIQEATRPVALMTTPKQQ